jgi:hypothetical protein
MDFSAETGISGGWWRDPGFDGFSRYEDQGHYGFRVPGDAVERRSH